MSKTATFYVAANNFKGTVRPDLDLHESGIVGAAQNFQKFKTKIKKSKTYSG